jgi:wyosine [tRNA(Phe)-imidazoG37] synthetase (radical SAM superfamily)
MGKDQISMKYVYGPVPSRRLGFSLGVDIVPYKTCTLDCIYCQLGRTTQKVIERKSFDPKDVIIEEIKKYISAIHNIDFITFSGSGEPTLNSDIGVLIRRIKEITSIPIAVLTNGTLIFREDVQEDLMEADVVLPSLDAASQEIFKRINRPRGSLKIETIIDGLKRFREFYKGNIWLEIMLVKGFNDDQAELSRIKKALTEIRPDKIHLNTVIRPPSETCAHPLNSAEMTAIKYFISENCEIIAGFYGKRKREAQKIEGSIIEMTRRRPVTVIDIANVFGISEANALRMVECLKAGRKLKEVYYRGKKYYSCKAK